MFRFVTFLPLLVFFSGAACSSTVTVGGQHGNGDAGEGGATTPVGIDTTENQNDNKPLEGSQCVEQENCHGYVCWTPDELPACAHCSGAPLCEQDGDCAELGDHHICIESGDCPCNSASYCIEGCVSDDDCETGQLCGSDHRCAERECTDSADCGPDYLCEGGNCMRRVCNSDSECGGYCVLGSCYQEPGACWMI